MRERNVAGEEEDILYVKGSGWDLETIEPAGFSPVALGYVRRLAGLPTLPDPQMVNELNTHLLRAGAPSPGRRSARTRRGR
ncbi:short chain dehydrogenase [compost metagenome]